MNWSRTILDAFAMAAYFNLFAAAIAVINPRVMIFYAVVCLAQAHLQHDSHRINRNAA